MRVLLLLLWLCTSASGFVQKGLKGYYGQTSTELLAVAKKGAKKKASKKKAAATNYKKGDFVADLAEATGQSKREAEMCLESVVEILKARVSEDQRINLPGFGTFQLRERSARKGRNPQTGEEIDIAASVSPAFTASKAWKDSLNGRS